MLKKSENFDKKVVPFLKWAGGKRWLVSNYSNYFPKKFNSYIEPFLGSGAVFFHLNPTNGILGDLNEELINTYLCLKNDWSTVYKELKKHHKKHSQEYYYSVRDIEYRSPHKRAAKFIYLNRTCWNGLYRVNMQGKFNVPIGTKTNVLLDSDDFQQISELLSNIELKKSDFEVLINSAQKDDFIFVDPPYTVSHNNNGFINYNEKIFSWEDQIRLKEVLIRANSRGAQIISTNACHSSIIELYDKEFNIQKVTRASVIAGKSSARKSYNELLITSK